MPLVLAWVVRMTASKYADEVVDAGDCLLVRRGSVQDRVELSNVLEVRGEGLRDRSQITLFLAQPGKFGRKIFFIALRNRSFWFQSSDDLSTHNDIAEDLARRLNR
jgi:hypothetical protein